MTNLFVTLAQTTAELTQAATQPASRPVTAKPWWAAFFENPIWLMVAVLLVFYFFIIRSKRNQDRQRDLMLKQLKRGDRIQTIGGILGTVVEARENEVLVKVDESSNAKIRFARSAIHRVLEEEKPQSK
ncbi:MAG TPA: preprotein translocase subunit YajC [Tepidisphaeraceae bacterium]|nr:preprotein translocase subunit YajC [Tepidisphaeraceae bacterium]